MIDAPRRGGRKHRPALVLSGLAGLLWLGTASEVVTTAEGPSSAEWRSFEGTWSAWGRREVVATEGQRSAAIVTASGAVVLTDGGGMSRGFRGQAIGYDNGQGSSIGRCVWTDEAGDQVFSRLEGESVETGKRLLGTITGGTGRYAGIEGQYSFTWQYVVSADEVEGAGLFQGRAIGLAGRFRRVGGAR